MYKLMIVEDEQIIRHGLIQTIPWESLGFTVTAEAADGKKALRQLEQDLPDVILTDIRMPIMDGLKLMSEVNDRFPQIKIVVLSGYGDFSYAQHAIQCGVLGYILKPTKDEEIHAAFSKVKSVLDSGKNTHSAANGMTAALEKPQKAGDPTIERIKQFIDEKYSSKITLETMAKIAYMNPSYFCTFFKQKTGISYRDYLTQVRIKKAMELIRTTDLKVYDIAAMVGYDDYRYFSKLFKEVYGQSVSEYRKGDK